MLELYTAHMVLSNGLLATEIAIVFTAHMVFLTNQRCQTLKEKGHYHTALYTGYA